MMSVRKKIKSWSSAVYEKIVHLNGTPEKIASGFALGAFIGVFPTFGLGGLLALFLAWLLRFNYASTVLGAVIIMNPITTPFFWGLSAAAGAALFSTDSALILAGIKNGVTFMSLGKITVIYLSGSLIVSSLVSFISYFIVKKFIIVYRTKQVKQ